MSAADMPKLPLSSINYFSECLYGGKGALDGWLECNDEAEVRAHMKAYADATAAAVAAPLVEELRSVLEWARTERCALRAQEIASIERTLAAIKEQSNA